MSTITSPRPVSPRARSVSSMLSFGGTPTPQSRRAASAFAVAILLCVVGCVAWSTAIDSAMTTTNPSLRVATRVAASVDSDRAAGFIYSAHSPSSSIANRSPSLDRIVSVGDSHGRDLVQSFLTRRGVPAIDKERDWVQTLPPPAAIGDELQPQPNVTVSAANLTDSDANATTTNAPARPTNTISHRYLGRPTVLQAPAPSQVDANTHVVLSRGTWDLMKYSTPLSRYYAEVRELVRGAAATEAASVTFKAVHRFAAPTAELGFFAECTQEAIVSAYRRVGACAVAAHNRDAAAPNTPPPRPVAVLDAWEATVAWPREAFADDGHHLVGPYLVAVADAFLASVTCPTSPFVFRDASLLPAHTDRIWMSSNTTSIEERFRCSEVERHVTANESSSISLEALFALPPRQGCHCMVEGLRENDRCAFGRLEAALESGDHRYFKPARAADALYSHASSLAHNKSAITAWHSNSTALRVVHAGTVKALGESVLEMCARPSVSLACLRNIDVQLAHSQATVNKTALTKHDANVAAACRCQWDPNVTSTPWCKEQARRLQGVSHDFVHFITFVGEKYRPQLRHLISDRRKSNLRVAIQIIGRRLKFVDSFITAFLEVACDATWTSLQLSNRRGRLKLATARVNELVTKHRAITPATRAKVEAARALAYAFDLSLESL